MTTGWKTGELHRDLSVLPEELAAYSWPCLALNERFEIIAWNAPALKVAELDFETIFPPLPAQPPADCRDEALPYACPELGMWWLP